MYTLVDGSRKGEEKGRGEGDFRKLWVKILRNEVETIILTFQNSNSIRSNFVAKV